MLVGLQTGAGARAGMALEVAAAVTGSAKLKAARHGRRENCVPALTRIFIQSEHLGRYILMTLLAER